MNAEKKNGGAGKKGGKEEGRKLHHTLCKKTPLLQL